MKLKKLLASILAAAMVLSTMSFTAFAAGDTDEANAVASIGDQYYSTVASAMADAQENDTIVIHKDVTVDEWQLMDAKNISIDGKNHSLTISAITKNTSDNQGSLIRAMNGELNIKDITFNLCPGSVVAQVTAGTMENVTVNGGKYGYLVDGATTIKNCVFNGQSGEAIYFRDGDGALGSVVDGCTFNLTNSRAACLWTNEVFTNNIINGADNLYHGLTILADSTATVSGNKFDSKSPIEVYVMDDTQGAFKLTKNVINGSVFVDGATVTNQFDNSVVENNTLSDAAIEGLKKINEDVVSVDYVATVNGKAYYSLADAIAAAKVNGDTVTLTTDLTIEAGNGGYNKAGIVQDGFDIDGNNHTLSVTNANDTWDCAIYTTGGTIKNLTIDSGFRGILTASQTEDIILENVTIDGPTYTISADGASGVKWIIKNSTLNGWTSYTSGFEVVSFENCTFGKGAGYAYMRPYADTIYTGCDFTDDYSVDVRAKVEVKDCTIDRTPMTAEDVAELLGGSAQAKIGDHYYASLEAAVAGAQANDIITIFAGEYDGFNVPVELNNVTFVGETDADGNNLVTIKTLEDGIESHNGGVFVQAETTTFKNLNFTAGTVLGARSGWMSSSLGNTNGDTGMRSSLKNLTVENCNFTGSGAYQAIWTNQGNVTVKNSTITNYDTAVDTYGIGADQKMVIENTEIADVRNAFHTGEAVDGSQIVVTETTIDSDVIDIGGAAAVTITNSEISNAVVTTYTENNQMTISGTLLIKSVINEEAKGTYNGVNIAEDYDAAVAAVAANNEIISTKLNISFRQVEAGLYDIVLDGEEDIYEFVGAELTFDNDSLTAGNEYMNYEILGISGKTNAEKSIEKADTYALRLVDDAERMSGRDLVIGQVKFFGQGDITFTVSEGKVVTTEYGTNLGQYYTVDTDDTTPDTLVVNGITNNKVEEVTRDVVVNVAYNHALDGTYWKDAAGNAANQITVTLKDGFGNVYDAVDLTNGVATINNVKLGRLTVTLEAPGFRKYVYNTTLEAGADANDALVLNFWNNVKRNEELNGVVVEPLAEIETGKGFMAHNFVVGDIVMDYTVDEYDLAAVTSYYGMYELTDADKYIKYDLNRDGNIDIIDVHYVLHTLNN